MTAHPMNKGSDAALLRIAERIQRRAGCLDHYAEMSCFKLSPVPSVLHLQSSHFRDLADELRALTKVEDTPLHRPIRRENNG